MGTNHDFILIENASVFFSLYSRNVQFAIESLIEHMSDEELEALLTFLNASEQSIACSYCSIPRLKYNYDFSLSI
jgi:hypothetical protein